MSGGLMKAKADISGKKLSRAKAGSRPAPPGPVLRDSAWWAEKKWFEENRSLDSLSLFAKYFQRLG
jgi:hypothetical protein